jgi:spore coat polysaccharide biosynthesis protein SpsF
MEDLHIVIIVQARMGSTRLPGKILKEVLGKPLLDYEMEQLHRVKHARTLAVATTVASVDDAVEAHCHKKGYKVFRGSEEDVLERYVQAARSLHADVVVRVSADCPLIDPAVVDDAIDLYLTNTPFVDYVSNTLERTYPRGLDVEVISFNALQEAHLLTASAEEREHVTPYIWRHPEIYQLLPLTQGKDESSHRWTVDTEEDFALIKNILEALYPTVPHFHKDRIIALFHQHPDWMEINRHIKQKTI